VNDSGASRFVCRRLWLYIANTLEVGHIQSIRCVPWRRHKGKLIYQRMHANGTRTRCCLIMFELPLVRCSTSVPIEDILVSIPGTQYTNTTHGP
jgi:hypothetical protein